MSKKINFIYSLNISREKYPDICCRLEEKKEQGSLAEYLRTLISNDIRLCEDRENLMDIKQVAKLISELTPSNSMMNVNEEESNSRNFDDPASQSITKTIKPKLPDGFI